MVSLHQPKQDVPKQEIKSLNLIVQKCTEYTILTALGATCVLHKTCVFHNTGLLAILHGGLVCNKCVTDE